MTLEDVSNSESEDVLAETTQIKRGRTVMKAKETVHRRRARDEPPTEEELQIARKRLQTAKLTKAIGTNIRVPTLYALCAELNIPVSRPGPRKFPTKATLLDLLANQVC